MTDGQQRALLARHRATSVRVHRSLLWHWFSRWWRAPAPTAKAVVPPPLPGQLALAFGGHSTVLLRYHNVDIVCDPMLGAWQGGVRRQRAAGLDAEQLATAAVVLISSLDPFHLHPPTLRLVPRTATVIVPPGGARHVTALGFARVIELGDGADFAEGRVLIHAARVARAELPATNAYVVRGHGPTVLFCGDGAYGEVFGDIGARFEPDIALLPISGFRPLALRANHMSPLDALEAFHDLRARLFVPVRWGAFTLSYERLDEPVRWLRDLTDEDELLAHVRVLVPGEAELFAAPSSLGDASAFRGAVPQRQAEPSSGAVVRGPWEATDRHVVG